MFITLEGIEGSGKTTQVRPIQKCIEKSGRECVVTREPGATVIGQKLRAVLLDPKHRGMDPLTELFLYEADRVEHVNNVIRPAISAGKAVICDRFFDATVVYQGYARGLDLALIHHLHASILGELKPDITFLLDLAPEVGLARAWSQISNGSRTGSESRFEEEHLSFHRKVRDGYLTCARNEPDRFVVIDAARDAGRVSQDILARVRQSLDERGYAKPR